MIEGATFSVILQGFVLSAGLIIAIGAQNAYVLKQSLKRQHGLAAATICILCDAVLISVGVGGVGGFIAASPLLTQLAAWGGAVFLLCYGYIAFRAALHPQVLELDNTQSNKQLKKVILTTFAITLLNPHVYLDTMVLIGGIAAQYEVAERLHFGMGAVSASVVWFLSLAYFSSKLAPLLHTPRAWKVIDIITGIIMWLVALMLVRNAL